MNGDRPGPSEYLQNNDHVNRKLSAYLLMHGDNEVLESYWRKGNIKRTKMCSQEIHHGLLVTL